MFKKAAQQGRSERKAETYSPRYVEALSDARTKLEAFFNILLGLLITHLSHAEVTGKLWMLWMVEVDRVREYQPETPGTVR